jgi:hypothetical protein
MPMNIKMPDGTIIQNVPDGTTRSQLMARYEKLSAAKAPAAPAQQPVNPPQSQVAPKVPQPTTVSPPSEDKGLLSRVAEDVSNRFQQGKQIMTTPGQNPFSVGLQMAGKVVAGTAGDIAGEVVKSAYKTFVPEDVQEKVKGGLQKIMSTPELQPGIEAVKRGALEYANWAKEHPEAAGNIESLVDIATLVPVGAGAKAVTATAKQIPVVKPISKGLALPSAEKLAKTTKGMYDTSQKTVSKIKEGGVVFHPVVGQEISTGLDKVIAGIPKAEKDLMPETVKKIADFKTYINEGDNSLRSFFAMQKGLKDVAYAGGDDAAAAKKALGVIDKVLTDKNIQKKVIAGDPKAASAIKQFNKEYGQYKAHETIVDAITPAEGKPALSSNQIRAKMSKLVDSDQFAFLTPRVQALVKQAAKGKTSGNILGATNKLKDLFKGHGGAATLAAGVGSAIAGHPVGLGIAGGVLAGSEASRQIAKGTVADILKAIQEGK